MVDGPRGEPVLIVTASAWGKYLGHLETRFDAEGVLWAPVTTLDEVLADPQAREMDVFEEVDHPRGGRIEMVSVPFHIDGADIHVRRSAPEIGEHTFEVLKDVLGYSDDEISEIAATGALT